MSTADSASITGGSADKSGSQITVQKSASVVQAAAQQTAAATFRTISSGQPSQVRVVMPPVTLMPQTMIKQIDSAGGVRTQITAIPATARTMSQTSITVTRPVTPTYIPRAGVTTTNIQAQRLTAPIRTPTPPTVSGLSSNFVRGAAVTSRNTTSSSTTTSISSGTATWMATSGTGQVQLIRAINHHPRQRIIAQNISTSTGSTGVVSVAQATNIGSGQNQQTQQQSQNNQLSGNIQTVQTSQGPQQQTFIATLATVMPPRQQTATLVYSNVSNSQSQQYNPTNTPTQRFTVAASLTGNQRQVRPIQLGNRTFSTAKLGVSGMNTTSISIRAPNIPVLTPTINTANNNSVQTRNTTTGNVSLSTTSLSTTRIIQLQQQQPGTGTQQIIGSTGRLSSNLMLQPIIMNTTSGSKIGIRPPTTIATKVQPSLTITQLGLGKISSGQQSSGSSTITATNIQNASVIPSSSNTSNVVVSAATANVVQQTSQQQNSICQQQTINLNVSNNQSQPITQIVGVNPNVSGNSSGQIIATQNVQASATVVPLAISSRTSNVLTGTITSLKTNAAVSSSISVPPIAKVIPQQQTSQNQQHHQSAQNSQIQSNQSGQQITEIISSNQQSHHQPTSVFIHTRPPSSNSGGSSSVIPNTGTFLPSGGTFYYESVPANSVSVSTGVISLTTTTVSTVSNSSLVSSSSNITSTGVVSSIPYNTPSGTFAVVPSSNRAIGQIQIPTSTSNSGQTQTVQAVPIRFNPQHLTDQPINISQAQQSQTQIQHLQQQAQQQQTQQNVQPHHQIITVTQQPQQSSQQHSQSIQQIHTIIPVQTSIKIATTGTSSPRTTSVTSIGSTFFRKRDSEGSPIRTTKNITSTLLAIGTNNNNNQQEQNSNQSSLGILAERNKESEQPSSPHSRPPSSGSTTVSANSSPGVDQQMSEEVNSIVSVNIKSESHFNPINDMYANHQNVVTPASLSSAIRQTQQQQQISNSASNGNIETSNIPRKKAKRHANNDISQTKQNQTTIIVQPQSQQKHNIQNIAADQSSQGNELPTESSGNNQVILKTDENNTKVGSTNKPNNTAVNNKENAKPTEYILKKPRTCTLLEGYRQNWKAANNHFQRYSDVKPRDERRTTVMDLANQAHVVQKINGWKLYHLSAQMEELCEIEMQSYHKLESMLKQLEAHEQSQDLDRVNELVKGNMQRSKIIVDGVNEARAQIMKIFDHKSHVSDIIHRCASKRNFKKREKT